MADLVKDLVDQSKQTLDPSTLNLSATPMQLGNEIRLAVQIADLHGLQFNMMLSINSAKAMMHLLRAGIESAETAIIRPIPNIAKA